MSKFQSNAITWFEIPTNDIERAHHFYESLLDSKLIAYPGDESTYIFPISEGGVSGCLVQRSAMKPAAAGPMVYLNVDGKLDATLERANAANVTMVARKTEIPGGHGFYAVLLDSEGNHFGLHSR